MPYFERATSMPRKYSRELRFLSLNFVAKKAFTTSLEGALKLMRIMSLTYTSRVTKDVEVLLVKRL